MEKKFIYQPVPMLGDVEENFIRFIGDNYLKSNNEFLRAFNEMVNGLGIGFTAHSNIISSSIHYYAIEMSKFRHSKKDYDTHELWIFVHQGEGKYDWFLNRYTV